MSDENEKFTSPTGHAIAKRETDSKPASGFQAALFSLSEAAECFQPETLEDLRNHFDTIRRALELAIALQPRPISEAPRDVKNVLVTNGEDYAVAYWNGEEWRDNADMGWAGMIGLPDNQPTHFYDLSALPKVEG